MDRNSGMFAMIAWMPAIAVSLVLMILTAASRPGNVAMGYAHMAVAAASFILFALWAIRRLRLAEKNAASRTALAARSSLYIGVVWGWAALVTFLTYGTSIMPAWREWQVHFVALLAIGCLCLGVAAFLHKSDARAGDDETVLKVMRLLAIGQLVAMLLIIIGLAVDGHMSRFLTERFVDWPAKHVMFFGAIAVAAISAASLRKAS